MGSLFGKKKNKNQEITSQDRAVLELKVQRDNLKRSRKKIESVIDKETEIAKQCLRAKKRKQALLALRRKKWQEQTLEKVEKMLTNVEEMTQSIEFKQMEQKVFDSLKSGKDALQQLNKMMSVEEVEQLMEENEEAMSYQNEIQELLAGQLTQEDEEDVLKELDEIIEMAQDEKEINMPKVPTKNPKKKQSLDEEEEEEEEEATTSSEEEIEKVKEKKKTKVKHKKVAEMI
ncbi:charged multivesicular body protein [Anaeramoeba flamelloides]|uniref:Charged multivesicular body protein n=1 Tax=Anaeramoeba flamelloides TaxID=1746091 RepID=A0ABQ8Y4I0_9EUKA|nr:charged multivesicular body protein [Anaeramoeba flamelloides]